MGSNNRISGRGKWESEFTCIITDKLVIRPYFT